MSVACCEEVYLPNMTQKWEEHLTQYMAYYLKLTIDGGEIHLQSVDEISWQTDL